MWWIVLTLTAAAAPNGAPDRPVIAARQATAVVRIAKPATVRLGETATIRRELTIHATDTRFRDADGREHPARIVEFP